MRADCFIMKQETMVKGGDAQACVIYQYIIVPEHKHRPAEVRPSAATMLILCANHKGKCRLLLPRPRGAIR